MPRRRVERRLCSLEEVTAGIERARRHQEEAGRPLMLEAVAWALGIHRETVVDYAMGHYIDDTAEQAVQALQQQIADALYQVYLECNLGIVNQLERTGSVTGTVLMARATYGYSDRQEFDPEAALPQFIGEDRLAE